MISSRQHRFRVGALAALSLGSVAPLPGCGSDVGKEVEITAPAAIHNPQDTGGRMAGIDETNEAQNVKKFKDSLDK